MLACAGRSVNILTCALTKLLGSPDRYGPGAILNQGRLNGSQGLTICLKATVCPQPLEPFSRQKSLIFDIGVKCNTQAIRRRLGIQAYSSPFDNMDSVHGLRDIAKILANERSDYFIDRDKWVIRNDYASRSNIVRAKVLYHIDFPGLFYPHFHAGWLGEISQPELTAWQNDPECSLDLVWNGFSSTFARRLDRLMSLLRDGKQISFIRIDEARSIQRIYSHGNTEHDINYFRQELASSGLQSFRLVYIYGNSPQYNRRISCSEHINAIPIKIDTEYDEQVDKALAAWIKDDCALTA